MYFKIAKVDIVVLEVGLGGRLDATNVIKSPLAAVITAIGLDHTDRLGGTIAEIAGEKAGIIKPGSTVVSYDHKDEARSVILKKAAETGDEIIFADNSAIRPITAGIRGQTFDYRDFGHFTLPLIGAHQLCNAAVAIETALVLRQKGFDISYEAICSGIKTVSWRGRLELLRERPPVLLDGAHNVHGVMALTGSLSYLLPETKFIFVCGMMSDKDYREMMRISAPLCAYMITTAPEENPRAADGDTLAAAAERYCENVSAAGSVPSALDRALEIQKKTGLPMCCFGTLYMSGEIRKYFESKEDDG